MYTYIYIYTYVGVYAKTDLVLVWLNYFCGRDVYTRDLRLGSFSVQDVHVVHNNVML